MIQAGIDEVGRGCLAGPVVACAIILPPRIRLAGLDDSKKLTASQRERLHAILTQKCDYGLGIVTAQLIDDIGIIQATNLAFCLAINRLTARPDHALIDGRDKLTLQISHTSIIKGDSTVRSIMAASVVAKVTRDRMMAAHYHSTYPDYDFHEHKGYGTRAHRSAIQTHGLTTIHRTSFCSHI